MDKLFKKLINFIIFFITTMNLPTELWYNTFSFLTQKSLSKFSSLWNLHNLSIKEIELIHCSLDNLLINIAKN